MSDGRLPAPWGRGRSGWAAARGCAGRRRVCGPFPLLGFAARGRCGPSPGVVELGGGCSAGLGGGGRGPAPWGLGGRGGRVRAAALVGGRYAVRFLGSASLRVDAVGRLGKPVRDPG